MNAKVANFEDEKRRRQALAAYCRHASAVLEMLHYSLEQLNPASRSEALRHIRKETERLLGS